MSAFSSSNITQNIELRNQLLKDFMANKSGIPPSFINEGLHGGAPGGTIFPAPITQGSTWNVSLVKAIATVIAAEARAIGVDTVFAPVVNMMMDPTLADLSKTPTFPA